MVSIAFVPADEFRRVQSAQIDTDLRLALLDYRAVFAQMIGPEMREPVAEGRRETA